MTWVCTACGRSAARLTDFKDVSCAMNAMEFGIEAILEYEYVGDEPRVVAIREGEVSVRVAEGVE